MIVMIEASTHTIAQLWAHAEVLMKGDDLNVAYAEGMKNVLQSLGVAKPQPAPQEIGR